MLAVGRSSVGDNFLTASAELADKLGVTFLLHSWVTIIFFNPSTSFCLAESCHTLFRLVMICVFNSVMNCVFDVLVVCCMFDDLESG